jgi:aminopeptidase N
LVTLTAGRRRLAALCAVLVGVAGAAFALTGSPADARRAPEPGSAGAGDGYFPLDGNGGYDVVHYAVDDTYRLGSARLTGRTQLSARATKDLSSFHLDLMLSPDAVSVNGHTAHFSKPSPHELLVTPRAPIGRGERFTVRVRYHGVPKELAWQGAKPWISSSKEALAVNEPQIAPWWFAVNDHPLDKASFDITIRVPRGNQVISNGTLESHTQSSDATGAWSTYHWRTRSPMAPYLAFFAAGHFRVERGTTDGLPYTIAVSRGLSPAHQEHALRLLRLSGPVTAWLTKQFGAYPFDSTGGVATSLFTGFALENQTRPVYDFYGLDRTTVVHELAHQWFGDDVSVRRWRDIWLNEGFASYTEWLYTEQHGGYSAQRQSLDNYQVYGGRSSFWKRVIADPGPSHVFTEPVYVRGAMTLAALRHRIGDQAFSRLLRTWVEQHAGGSATVGDFEKLAESVSGQQLDGFFRAWLHTGSKPEETAANGLR